jgi:V-type H+-transporting ATPase subunit E
MTRRSIDDLAAMGESKQASQQRSEIFSLYQARLRAEEIDFLAREQHEAELSKLVNLSYSKLNADYEHSRLEIDRTAKIQFSTTKNSQRIRVLTSQQDIVEEARTATRVKLAAFRTTDAYKSVLTSLISQALDILNESDAVVHVVAADIKLAEGILPDALRGKSLTATIDTDNPLSEKMIGGAVVVNGKGTIQVDNSFEGRLNLAVEGSLPQISVLLKPKS